MTPIPNYYRGATKHVTKRSMAKRFPAPYCYTSSSKNWVIRYTSNKPGFAVAEAWRDKITKSYAKMKTWCLIEQLDEEACFFMLVQDNVVQEAGRSNKDDLNVIWLKRSEKIFLVDGKPNTHLPEGIYGVSVEQLTPDELKKFALKPTNPLKVTWISAAIAASLLAMGGIGLTILSPTPKPVQTSVPDPYDDYRQTLTSSINAAVSIDNLVAMAAHGSLIPDGWSLELISLQNNDLVLVANREPTGLRPVIQAWLTEHSSLKPYANVSLNKLTVTHSQQETLAHWQHKSIPVTPMGDTLIDTLIALGWTVSNHTIETMPPMAKSTVNLSLSNGLLADLQSLSGILKQLPVALSLADLKPTSTPGRFNISLTLTYIGGA